MRDYTSIQVTRETKNRLKGLKVTPTETFEHVLLRLLDCKLKGRELSYKIADKHSRHFIYVKVDWGSPEQNILYYLKEDELHSSIPDKVFNDDVLMNAWLNFVENIKGLDNLFYILAVLDSGDSIDAGDLSISRLS